MKYITIVLCLATFLSCNTSQKIATPIVEQNPINIEYPGDHYAEALDGRMILLLSDHKETELRFQLRDDVKSCQGFGMDVEDWQNGKPLQFIYSSFGYPIQNMSKLEDGTYFMQILFCG